MLVRLTLTDAALELDAVIVRVHPCAGGGVLLGLHFTNASERVNDQIRREVFARLRALRASGRL